MEKSIFPGCFKTLFGSIKAWNEESNMTYIFRLLLTCGKDCWNGLQKRILCNLIGHASPMFFFCFFRCSRVFHLMVLLKTNVVNFSSPLLRIFFCIYRIIFTHIFKYFSRWRILSWIKILMYWIKWNKIYWI